MLKSAFKSLCAAVFAMFFIAGTPAFGVELRLATNQQILDELAYRLRTGGGGGGNGGSRATFACDSSTYLQIAVLGSSGNETTEQIYIGNAAECARQSQQLSANRSRINDTTMIAICNSSTYLLRYSITREGALNELQSRYIGNMANCISQADAININ